MKANSTLHIVISYVVVGFGKWMKMNQTEQKSLYKLENGKRNTEKEYIRC